MRKTLTKASDQGTALPQQEKGIPPQLSLPRDKEMVLFAHFPFAVLIW